VASSLRPRLGGVSSDLFPLRRPGLPDRYPLLHRYFSRSGPKDPKLPGTDIYRTAEGIPLRTGLNSDHYQRQALEEGYLAISYIVTLRDWGLCSVRRGYDIAVGVEVLP